MISNEEIEAGIYLFLKTLYDFTPYLKRPDEQERLINMPKTVKIVLREIIASKIFSELILDNEYKKAEEKRKEKIRRREERKRQLIEGIKPMKIQDENYENNLKLMKNKRSLNTSCFNQRSIQTLNQYYNSVNEMMCIKDSVLNKIKKLEHDCVMSCIELEKRNIIVHDKFILMNPKNKNKLLKGRTTSVKPKKENIIDTKYKTASNSFKNDMMLSRGFMSLDNYYKFIKNNMNKINESHGKIQTSTKSKHFKLFDDNDNENKKEDKRKWTYNRFRAYNTETRGFLPHLKSDRFYNNNNKMNFVLLNKDVKYQVKRSYNKHKKNVHKDKYVFNVHDYDYKNILCLFK